MNIYQRIILIIGAIVLVVVLLTSPKVLIIQGSIRNPSKSDLYASVPYVRTASVRVFATLGVTALLFFALKSKKKE